MQNCIEFCNKMTIRSGDASSISMNIENWGKITSISAHTSEICKWGNGMTLIPKRSVNSNNNHKFHPNFCDLIYQLLDFHNLKKLIHEHNSSCHQKAIMDGNLCLCHKVWEIMTRNRSTHAIKPTDNLELQILISLLELKTT